MLGKIADKSVEEKVDREHQLFGDLLQISVPEGYENLSFKSISGFVWIDRLQHLKLQ
jgi:hypothetical protein